MALWRETLLAQAVLRGNTRGYRNHPQLERFRNHAAPLCAISRYLNFIHEEAKSRGYSFNESKVGPSLEHAILAVTSGQMEYEWAHLMKKLEVRNPVMHQRWRETKFPESHPLFEVWPGEIEPWERR